MYVVSFGWLHDSARSPSIWNVAGTTLAPALCWTSRRWVNVFGIWTRYAVWSIGSNIGGSHPRMVRVPPRFGVCARARDGATAAPVSATPPSTRRSRRERVIGSSVPGLPMCAAELENAVADALRCLLGRHHGPVFGLWEHLAQVVGTRSGVRRIVAGKDERGHGHGQQLLRLGAGRRLAIEEIAQARGNDAGITLRILRLERFGEGRIGDDRRGPRASFGVLPERLAFVRALDDAGEPVVPGKAEMPREAVGGVHLPAIPAHRPVQDERLRGFRIEGGKRRGDAAAHAAAEHERPVDAQVLEELSALLGEEGPGEPHDAATRVAGLAPIVGNDMEVLGQRIEGLHALPH